MSKLYGIEKLIEYLASKNYPLSDEKIRTLIHKKIIPHQNPVKGMYSFDMNHIDWWVNEQRSKK
ncbi:hypothetical protein P6709_02215 [Jeotgalibacillus sp. ET6]|uniref:hypothetical protein n=1 Tax=Jeotgalibacillus sp. ET6 TaxID=3037260 RepID=UPI002418B494|nr:hypothetical protein [Jeotgalibacillus sp. ET6]MDG5470544.1 hypothetical protein [Jeotgalibacillus sp. ET6]